MFLEHGCVFLGSGWGPLNLEDRANNKQVPALDQALFPALALAFFTFIIEGNAKDKVLLISPTSRLEGVGDGGVQSPRSLVFPQTGSGQGFRSRLSVSQGQAQHQSVYSCLLDLWIPRDQHSPHKCLWHDIINEHMLFILSFQVLQKKGRAGKSRGVGISEKMGQRAAWGAWECHNRSCVLGARDVGRECVLGVGGRKPWM